jgi:hypothetical protein
MHSNLKTFNTIRFYKSWTIFGGFLLIFPFLIQIQIQIWKPYGYLPRGTVTAPARYIGIKKPWSRHEQKVDREREVTGVEEGAEVVSAGGAGAPACAASRDGNGAGSGRVEHTHARPDMGSG